MSEHYAQRNERKRQHTSPNEERKKANDQRRVENLCFQRASKDEDVAAARHASRNATDRVRRTTEDEDAGAARRTFRNAADRVRRTSEDEDVASARRTSRNGMDRLRRTKDVMKILDIRLFRVRAGFWRNGCVIRTYMKYFSD